MNPPRVPDPGGEVAVRPVWVAIVSVPVVLVLLTAGLIGWRVAPGDLVFVGLSARPSLAFAGDPGPVLPLMRYGAPLVATALFLVGIRAARRRAAGRAFAELVAGPGLVLAALWSGPDRGVSWPMVWWGLAALGAHVMLVRRDGGGPGWAVLGPGGFGAALRLVVGPTLAAATLLAVLGHLAGRSPDPGSLAVALATYPLYALIQLLVFLAVPWPRWRALGAPVPAAAAGCALVFALAHWPNPVAVPVTAVAMIGWALTHARTRDLWASVLSMALLAAVMTQALPRDWTEHMRTGPRAVFKRSYRAGKPWTSRRDEAPGGLVHLVGRPTNPGIQHDDGQAQQIRGNCSPTGRSTMRSAPRPVFIATRPG